eukprot:scaffold105755_cov36-Attheya_sp.AAC.1
MRMDTKLLPNSIVIFHFAHVVRLGTLVEDSTEFSIPSPASFLIQSSYITFTLHNTHDSCFMTTGVEF